MVSDPDRAGYGLILLIPIWIIGLVVLGVVWWRGRTTTLG